MDSLFNLQMWASIASFLAQALTIPVMRAYDPSHQLGDIQDHKVLSSYFPSNTVPKALYDPSPATFAACSLLYAASALAFYHLHREGKYQNTILFQVSCSSVWIAYVVTGRLLEPLRSYLPSAVTAALVLSAVGHRYWQSSYRKDHEYVEKWEGMQVQ